MISLPQRKKTSAAVLFLAVIVLAQPVLAQTEIPRFVAQPLNTDRITYEAFFTASGDVMVLDGYAPGLWHIDGSRVGELEVDGYLLYGVSRGLAPSRLMGVVVMGAGGVGTVDLASGEMTVLRPEPEFEYPPDDYPGVVENPNAVVGLGFDPTGCYIGAMTRENGLFILPVDGGEGRWVGDGANERFALGPDGQVIAIVWDNGGVVFDSETGVRHNFNLPHGAVSDLAFDTSGGRLAIAHASGMTLVDTATGTVTLSTSEPTDGRIERFDDETLIVSRFEGGTATLNDVLAGELIGHVTSGVPIASIDFDLDRGLAVVVTVDYSVLVLPLDQSEAVSFPQGTGDGFRPAFVAGHALLIWGPDGSAPGLWDLSELDLVRWLAGEGGPAVSVRVSADGETAAAASIDGVVRFWELSTGNLLRVIRPLEPGVGGADVSPDLTMVVLNSGGSNVGLYSAEGGGLIASFPNAGDGGLAFGPDGSLLATGWLRMLGDVSLWNIEGDRLETMPVQTTQVRTLRIASGGNWILANGMTGSAELWLRGVPESVYVSGGGDFDPTGVRFVTAGNLLRIAQMETSDQSRPFTSALSAGYSEAVFSPDGQQIAAVTSDSVCEIWDANEERLLFTLHADAEGNWAIQPVEGEASRGQLERPALNEPFEVIVVLQ